MLKSNVVVDKTVEDICKAFDYQFDGTSTFTPPTLPTIPEDFGIGLLVGASGSGKTTLLKMLDVDADYALTWEKDLAIASHFDDADEAKTKFAAVGLNSVPSMLRPYHALSNGEQHRADIALRLRNGAVIDEFTSVVDRNVARSLSVALRRYVTQSGTRRIILASCHRDIIEWLQPDWIFDLDTNEFKECLQRPELRFELYETKRSTWEIFRRHHYLSDTLVDSSRCFVLLFNGTPVGFTAALAMPSGVVKNAWREHRTVVLPDFQGLGIGTRLSDTVASLLTGEGKRYYSKTAHYRMGGYRTGNPNWRPTKHNLQRTNPKPAGRRWVGITNRRAWSHEYIGGTPDCFERAG